MSNSAPSNDPPSHTPEPWRLGNLESFDAYTGKPFRNIWAGGDGETGDGSIVVARCIDNGNCNEDAARIVAAVNAVKGLGISALESGVVAELVGVLETLCGPPLDDAGAAELARRAMNVRERLRGKIAGHAAPELLTP